MNNPEQTQPLLEEGHEAAAEVQENLPELTEGQLETVAGGRGPVHNEHDLIGWTKQGNPILRGSSSGTTETPLEALHQSLQTIQYVQCFHAI